MIAKTTLPTAKLIEREIITPLIVGESHMLHFSGGCAIRQNFLVYTRQRTGMLSIWNDSATGEVSGARPGLRSGSRCRAQAQLQIDAARQIDSKRR